MSALVLKRARIGWNQDDFDVLEDSRIVGRIFKVPITPADRPWIWTSGHNGSRGRDHGRDSRHPFRHYLCPSPGVIDPMMAVHLSCSYTLPGCHRNFALIHNCVFGFFMQRAGMSTAAN
jgi:hypothetical protein